MNLAAIDLIIIFLYLVATVAIGFWLSKRASKNMGTYFLAGNDLPWYALGLSNASGMFDVSGTMIAVAWLFVYGLKSAWIPWLWPVWNQIFMMIFLAAWMRRSNVLTGAEWITFRFGKSRGSTLSHIITVLFAYTVRFLTAGFSTINSSMLRITRNLDEASMLLGVSGIKLLKKIHIPILKNGLFIAAMLVFVDVMKEMPITLMTRPFGWDTLAVKIFELTSEGEWQRAALPSVTLILAGLIPLMLLNKKADQPILKNNRMR